MANKYISQICYREIAKHTSADRQQPYLGRVLDPLNIQPINTSFSFISKVWSVKNHRTICIRDPQKVLTHSLSYTGAQKNMRAHPELHRALMRDVFNHTLNHQFYKTFLES